MASHFRTLRIKEIRTETAECVSVSFEIPDHLKEEFQYTQGQNITLRAIIGGEEIRRSYSICSSPLEGELRVAIKKQPAGKFSSFVHDHLKKMDSLDVLPPTGKFFTELAPSNNKSYVGWAAGSGITPLISIIKTTLIVEPNSRFTLIYGNRGHQSIIFKEELEMIKNRFMDRFNVMQIFSREQTESSINQGRIDLSKCNQLWQQLPWLKQADEYFICGPSEMIFLVKEFLEKQSVAKKNIHYELFGIPGKSRTNGEPTAIFPASQNEQEAISEVTVKLDGISFGFKLAYQGLSLLDAALRQGADLPFSCKGGVCATCRAKLLEGNVEMDNNYALQQEEIEAGFILTCQSHPRTPVISIDFDKRV